MKNIPEAELDTVLGTGLQMPRPTYGLINNIRHGVPRVGMSRGVLAPLGELGLTPFLENDRLMAKGTSIQAFLPTEKTITDYIRSWADVYKAVADQVKLTAIEPTSLRELRTATELYAFRLLINTGSAEIVGLQRQWHALDDLLALSMQDAPRPGAASPWMIGCGQIGRNGAVKATPGALWKLDEYRFQLRIMTQPSHAERLVWSMHHGLLSAAAKSLGQAANKIYSKDPGVASATLTDYQYAAYAATLMASYGPLNKGIPQVEELDASSMHTQIDQLRAGPWAKAYNRILPWPNTLVAGKGLSEQTDFLKEVALFNATLAFCAGRVGGRTGQFGVNHVRGDFKRAQKALTDWNGTVNEFGGSDDLFWCPGAIDMMDEAMPFPSVVINAETRLQDKLTLGDKFETMSVAVNHGETEPIGDANDPTMKTIYLDVNRDSRFGTFKWSGQTYGTLRVPLAVMSMRTNGQPQADRPYPEFGMADFLMAYLTDPVKRPKRGYFISSTLAAKTTTVFTVEKRPPSVPLNLDARVAAQQPPAPKKPDEGVEDTPPKDSQGREVVSEPVALTPNGKESPVK